MYLPFERLLIVDKFRICNMAHQVITLLKA